MANNVLPFIILRTQLEELKAQIALEHKAQVDANVKSTIDTPEIKSIISGVLSRANIELADDISEKVIYEIASYASHTSQITPILNLSDFDRFELTAKINSLLAYDTNRVKEATDDIKASLKCVKRIRKKMERSSIENYDGYLQMKSDLNEQKSKCTQQLLEVDKELQELRAQKAISASKLSKAKSDYEALLKKQSINDISARALLAFDELQKTLYDKSIRLVETGFSQFFASLINKSDLIDGIHIDDSLNVLPYKNKHFKADEIRKIIGKNGVEYLVAQIGLYAYEVLQQKLIAGETEFELPVEVKQQLSAGEKQIFIMALYQALSQLNKINVPYIVDTPFARIDKEHRGKILSQFFKKLNGQIIILSTDEEIVGDYRESISDIVSNTLAKRLAWIYIKSKLSLSSLIIPSIPPSCGFPVTIPEFLSYPYPIFKSKSTTRCSKNSGELFRTESNTCCRIFCKCSCSAALIFSSGNSSEISVVLGAVIIVAVFSVEIKRNLIFFPS